ncbi:hypothetical protein AY599_20580 [Leptolyngbya valderiana BDU 20041]|nr:hypothetical protein AY599_20580 [Leptolyngbya valderiana BDU 20041]
MAAQRKPETVAKAWPAPAAPRLRAADASATAQESPALTLQQTLYGAYEGQASAPADKERWSARRAAAFLVLSCGTFWAAIAYAVSLLF